MDGTEPRAKQLKSLDAIPRRMGRGGYDSHLTAINAAKECRQLRPGTRFGNQVAQHGMDGRCGRRIRKMVCREFRNCFGKDFQDRQLRTCVELIIERIGKIAAGGTEEQIVATASSFSSLDRLAFMKGVVGKMATTVTGRSRPVSGRKFQRPELAEGRRAGHPAVGDEGSGSGDRME